MLAEDMAKQPNSTNEQMTAAAALKIQLPTRQNRLLQMQQQKPGASQQQYQAQVSQQQRQVSVIEPQRQQHQPRLSQQQAKMLSHEEVLKLQQLHQLEQQKAQMQQQLLQMQQQQQLQVTGMIQPGLSKTEDISSRDTEKSRVHVNGEDLEVLEKKLKDDSIIADLMEDNDWGEEDDKLDRDDM